MSNYFVIRLKNTDKYFPYSHRSNTSVEATNAEPPRLFTRRQDASTALTWWLKGDVTVSSHVSGGHSLWGDDEWISDEFHISPVKGRNKDDYEIVEIEIKYLGVGISA